MAAFFAWRGGRKQQYRRTPLVVKWATGTGGNRSWTDNFTLSGSAGSYSIRATTGNFTATSDAVNVTIGGPRSPNRLPKKSV